MRRILLGVLFLVPFSNGFAEDAERAPVTAPKLKKVAEAADDSDVAKLQKKQFNLVLEEMEILHQRRLPDFAIDEPLAFEILTRCLKLTLELPVSKETKAALLQEFLKYSQDAEKVLEARMKAKNMPRGVAIVRTQSFGLQIQIEILKQKK